MLLSVFFITNVDLHYIHCRLFLTECSVSPKQIHVQTNKLSFKMNCLLRVSRLQTSNVVLHDIKQLQ